MSKSQFLCLSILLLCGLPLFGAEGTLLPIPLAAAAEPSLLPSSSDATPTRLVIPSIKLNAAVEEMGLNAKGELDVPSGKTKNVGWYKDGTIPGQRGSAVMDAHVYAALSSLSKAKVGDDIYVTMNNGVTYHFKITLKKTAPLSQVSGDELFNQASGRELHLITCAGTFSKKTGTYDKRLLVYATLVE